MKEWSVLPYHTYVSIIGLEDFAAYYEEREITCAVIYIQRATQSNYSYASASFSDCPEGHRLFQTV